MAHRIARFLLLPVLVFMLVSSGFAASVGAQAKPTLGMPHNVIPGQFFNLTGAHFGANTKVSVTQAVKITDGTVKTTTKFTTTDKNGVFKLTLQTPETALQSRFMTIVVLQVGVQQKLGSKIWVRPLHPAITLSPAGAAAGQKIAVKGTGYHANAPIKVSVAGIQVAAAKTDNVGAFTAQFTIAKTLKPGAVTVQATDQFGATGKTSLNVTTAPGPQPKATAKPTTQATKPAPHATATTPVPANAQIQVYPQKTIPGANVFVSGAGFSANSQVTIYGHFKLTSGQIQTVTVSTKTDNKGFFFHVAMRVPGSAGAANDTLKAVMGKTSATASLTIQPLKPTIVLSPATATPGMQVIVQGFGFSANTAVTITFNGVAVAHSQTGPDGRFRVSFVVPAHVATGSYTVVANVGGGRVMHALTVQRKIATTYYFAEGNTSYAYGLYLAVLNPGNIQGRMTVTYYNNQGQTIVRNYTLPAHTRKTLDVRHEVGANRGVAMKVTADVPIAAERVIYHGADGAMSPGATGLNTHWYFSEGNTLHGYSEWIPMLNPNNAPAQVHMLLLTTHHGSHAINFTLGAHTRISLHVNKYVAPDAVGVAITSTQPIVAERTVYYNNGGAIFLTNKVGMNSYGSRWYFPAGQTFGGAIEWISAANPSSTPAHLTMSIYSAKGDLLQTVHRTVPADGRKGYKIDELTPNADISVIVKSDQPVLSERLLYTGQHNALTDNFGVENPGTAWWFANGDTRQSEGYHDSFAVFNPNLGPAPVIVRIMTWSGKVINVPYLIPPTTKQHINLDTVAPNSQFGVVVNSTVPITVEHFITFNNGRGGMTTHGIHGY